MPEMAGTDTNFFPISIRESNLEIPELDPRAAAKRLRAQARRLPPWKLDYAAELVRTASELEQAADEREKRERIAAAGVQQ